MKKTIMSTNLLNKVIAAMMMAFTFAMPAMAGNKTTVSNSRQHKNGKHDKVVVVVDKKTAVSTNRKGAHFHVYDKKPAHYNVHKHVYRPVVKACVFKVSRHDSHKMAAARAGHMKGVMNTQWNPRTRELTVIYDAKVTSARHIMHYMA